jgi:predicted ribosomally synthesized peptide with nif11-like leader
MSVVTAHGFLELLRTQPEVRDQLYTAAPANAHDLLGFAMQKGYIMSEQDLRTALEEHGDKDVTDSLLKILNA